MNPDSTNRSRRARAVLSIALLLTLGASAVPLAAQHKAAAPPRPSWIERLGGAGTDMPAALAATSDGGMFVAGWTDSFGAGNEDLWVTRLDRRGTTLFERALGGRDNEEAAAVIATSDGGCLVAGSTFSFGAGSTDGWLVKLDASGNVSWSNAYGGPDEDRLVALAPSPDGYFAAGTTISETTTGYDAWVFEIDPLGNVLWQQTFAGDGLDFAAALAPTDDGGLAFVIDSSTDFPGVPGAPFFRPWLVRLDGDGQPLWQRAYNLSGGDLWSKILALDDGGFVVTGEILSAAFFRGDVWVVRLDSNGKVEWDQRFGDNFQQPNYDGGLGIRPSLEGGFVVFGATFTARDGLWLIQLDAQGRHQWDRSYGSGGFDNAVALDVSPDGELLFCSSAFLPGANDSDALVFHLPPNGRPPKTCELSHATDPNNWSSPLMVDPVTFAPQPGSLVTTPTTLASAALSSGSLFCAPPPNLQGGR